MTSATREQSQATSRPFSFTGDHLEARNRGDGATSELTLDKERDVRVKGPVSVRLPGKRTRWGPR